MAYSLHLGLSEQVGVWAGALAGNLYLDDALFARTCRQLETALPRERYQEALERGKALKFENMVSDILMRLGGNSEDEASI